MNSALITSALVILSPSLVALLLALCHLLENITDEPWTGVASSTMRTWNYDLQTFALHLAVLFLWSYPTKLVFEHLGRTYKKKWWDISDAGPKEEVKWENIYALCNFGCEAVEYGDPLSFKVKPLMERIRPCSWRYQIRDSLIVFVFTCSVLCTLYLVSHTDKVSANSFQKYGIGIAVVTASIALFGHFINARAKTRAENRQAWVNELREVLDKLIRNMPGPVQFEYDDEVGSTTLHPRRRVLHKLHVKLELYYNPSERMHRTFLAFINLAYGELDVPLDDAVWDGLAQDREDLDLSREEEWSKHKTRTIRIANYLLKREWEQVKSIS